MVSASSTLLGKRSRSYIYAFYACLLWGALLLMDVFFVQISFSNASFFGNAVVSGALLNVPYTEFYLKDFWAYGLLTTPLYHLFPGVAWLPLLFLALMLFALVPPTALVMIKWSSFSNKNRIGGLMVLAGCVAALNLDLVTLEHNRVAFMLMTGGLIIPLLRRKDGVSIAFLMYTAMATLLSVFLRVEAAIGALLVMGPVLLYQYKHGLRLLCVWIAIPLLIVCVYATVFFVALEKSPLFYYQIEPDFEYELMDKNNIVPLSAMRSKEDSMRYEAIGHFWFLGDADKVPTSFIRSLIDKKQTPLQRFLPSLQGREFKTVASKVLSLGKQPVTWLLLLTTIFVLFRPMPLRERLFIGLWVGYVLFLLVIVVGSINQDIEPRIAEPVILTAVCALMPCLFATGIKATRGVLSVAASILFVAVLMQFQAKERNAAMQQAGKRNQIFLEQVNAHPSTYIALLTYGDLFNFAPSPFASGKMFPSKKVIPLHLAQYSHTNDMNRFIQSVTGCKEHRLPCMLQFLVAHKEKTLLIATPGAMEFFQRYMSVMYGFAFTYSIVDAQWSAGDERVFMLN